MAAALGGVKNYTLKTYLNFAEKLQEKAEVCKTSLHSSLKLVLEKRARILL